MPSFALLEVGRSLPLAIEIFAQYDWLDRLTMPGFYVMLPIRIVAIILMSLFLVYITHPERGSITNNRSTRQVVRENFFTFWPIALTLTLGVTLALYTFLISADNVMEDRRTHLIEGQAHPRVMEVQGTIDRYFEVVNSLATANVSYKDGDVDHAIFADLARRGISRNPGIQALEWVPRVTNDGRDTFEHKDHNTGHGRFEIREASSDGRMRRAATREEYYPVHFILPLEGNEPAFGFDLASNPKRRKALEHARDQGMPLVTAGIQLVQETDHQTGILYLVPVYRTQVAPETVALRREEIEGFVLGAFPLGNLIASALSEFPAMNCDFYLVDESSAAEPTLLHFIPNSQTQETVEKLPLAQLQRASSYSASLNVAGRSWRIYFDHKDAKISPFDLPFPFAIAALIFLLVFSLAAGFAFLANRRKAIAILVAERTADLNTANSSLRASESRFAGILDVSFEAIISIDGDHRICLFNQGAVNTFGYRAEEALGQPITMLMPARFRKTHDQHVRKFHLSSDVSRRSGSGSEILGLRKNGEEFPAEFTISKLETKEGVVFTMMLQDVSEQREIEEALRINEGSLRALFDHAPAAVSMKDLNGKFLLTTSSFCDYFLPAGVDPTGKIIDEINDCAFMEELVIAERKVFETQTVLGGEIEVFCKDDKLRIFEYFVFPIFDKAGHLIGVSCICADETGRRKAESQLRQDAKMDALGTLAGGIAHDLNNTLVPILALTELTMDQVPEGSTAQSNLSKVLQASIRGRDLVTQILEYSHPKEAQRSEINLCDVIEDALSFMRSSFPKNIKICANLEASEKRVFAEESQVHRVLMNLCINATHAMEKDGGTLTVAVSQIDIGGRPARRNSRLSHGPHLVLSVSDTGEGIDKSNLDKVFDPFFTTKEVGQGTGMGLSIVHSIVEQFQGDIQVESKPGEGTTFYVCFPIHQNLENIDEEQKPLSEAS